MGESFIPSSLLGRRHTRFATQSLVWWQDPQNSVPLVVCDVSEGGLLCEMSESLKMGAQIELMVESPQCAKVVNVVCSVAHVRQMGKELFLVGLELQKDSPVHGADWVALFLD
ncbi:MAG: PilZ domain-containing protein [Acidobacteria bacterium]|nr:PilZ domain-containing protein [Acidobacteriota bacterium]MCB9398518.1 PilZ domain-containing protein [Acidobacteriota bacterium]